MWDWGFGQGFGRAVEPGGAELTMHVVRIASASLASCSPRCIGVVPRIVVPRLQRAARSHHALRREHSLSAVGRSSPGTLLAVAGV